MTCTGTTINLTMAEYASAVLTAISTGTCRKRINSGAVITPAPTPLSAITTAMQNPITKSISVTLSDCVLRGLQMDAALLLPAAPTSRAGIVGVKGQAGAGFAADAGVAFVVEMEEWNVVLAGVVPDVLRGPLGKWADLANGPGSGQRKVFDWLECCTTFSLFATEAGETELVAIELGKEWFDLPQTATATGIGLVEDAELRLLLGHSEFGHK